MSSDYYNSKLQEIVSNTDKFITCPQNQTETVKKKINEIAKPFKETDVPLYKKLRRVGGFYEGHLYGLPKIHKNETSPPLRPIISMSGTVTHDISQHLNSVIRPYINSTYIIKSSDELLVRLGAVTLKPGQQMLSLDVESLFTNVPVEDTINIIIEAAYNHPTVAPPQYPPEVLRKLLKICTTETPFQFNGTSYVQVDGVSMGSPLGPTFADFYMSALENYVLSQENRVSNPVFFVRYVDDILAVFNNSNHIRHFVNRLKNNSVLNFTTEMMKDNIFHFLDVKLTVKPTGQITTSVYVKPTDRGTYSNFRSHIPDNYKKSVVKTLINRAVKFSSSWLELNVEISRLKQVFANNCYPQFLVDDIVNRRISKFKSGDVVQADVEYVDFYVRLGNLSNFKKDGNTLKCILDSHVRPTNDSSQIRLRPYFKPYKLQSAFSTRLRKESADRVSVVYKFSCPEVRCNATYIGYTTNTLATRVSQHRYSSSSIRSHFAYDHQMGAPKQQEFLPHFQIIHSYSDRIDLKIAEALEIRKQNPYINVKYNESYQILNLYNS